MAEWAPPLSRLGKPRYLAIADAIAEDISNGKLAPSDRLPPQRKLARRLDIDFTTVARGYIEAQRRGLIESRVGQGPFVRAPAKRRHSFRKSRERLEWISQVALRSLRQGRVFV